MSARTEYIADVEINGRRFSRVIIDQHYQSNHPEMNDHLILALVKKLHGSHFSIEEKKDEFEYFTVEPILYKNKPYRLVLLLHAYDHFLGVINAFRVRR